MKTKSKLTFAEESQLKKKLNEYYQKLDEILVELYVDDVKIDGLKQELSQKIKQKGELENDLSNQINRLTNEIDLLDEQLSYYSRNDKVQELVEFVKWKSFFSVLEGKAFLQKSSGILWNVGRKEISSESGLNSYLLSLQESEFDVPLKEEWAALLNEYMDGSTKKDMINFDNLNKFNLSFFGAKDDLYHYKNAAYEYRNYDHRFSGLQFDQKHLNHNKIFVVSVDRRHVKSRYLEYVFEDSPEYFSAYLVLLLSELKYKFDDPVLVKIANSLIKKEQIENEINRIVAELGESAAKKTKAVKRQTYSSQTISVSSENHSKLAYLLKLDNFLGEQLSVINDFVNSEHDTLRAYNDLIVKNISDEPSGYEVVQQRNNSMFERLEINPNELLDRMNVLRAEVQDVISTIKTAASFEQLVQVEKKQFPSFEFVIDKVNYDVELLSSKVEFFKNSDDILRRLIGLHKKWYSELDHFHKIELIDFDQTCKKNAIDESFVKGWNEKWIEERIRIERKVTDIIIAVLDEKIPIDQAELLLLLLWDGLRGGYQEFYSEKVIPIHQKYAFDAKSGRLLEMLDNELELKRIINNFQSSIEEIIFSLSESDDKLFILQWASEWYESQFVKILDVIKNTSIDQFLSSDTINEFRQLKERNLESVIFESGAYKKEVDELSNEFNSLLFRMKKEAETKFK
ncbi:MAG: hypothetical protein L6Q47_06610 [Ignavibacteriaceae bacterium]|nr:hypothetical protein [Ignavibacteriaceae bacterium]